MGMPSLNPEHHQHLFKEVMKTVLADRVLWFDGDITFTSDQLMDYILNGGSITGGIHVNALNEDIELFNKMNQPLSVNVKRDLDHLDHTWQIPDSYKQINIKSYVHKKLLEIVEKPDASGGFRFTESQIDQRIERVSKELELFKTFDMEIILRAIIYILDIFRLNNVVWGTGRGSSCNSYVLYLIGLHSVDSVEYELDLKEFFR
jgi:DNA polymerase III alpha subunit